MKRKIISTLFALVLVFTLGLVTAVPAGADPSPDYAAVTLVADGAGTAEWSTTYARTGSYSVELYSPGTADYGKVIMPLDMAFADLADFSFWVEGGESTQALPLHDIKLDIAGTATAVDLSTGNGNHPGGASVNLADKIVVLASQPGQEEALSPTLMSDGIAGWEKYGTHTDATINVSGTDEYWSIFVYSAGGAWESVYDYFTWDEIHTALDEYATVTEVRAELRYPQNPELVASTVYVDDIEINGVTYDLEPRVINTDTSEGFNTIQAAIDDEDTDAGDTITVAAGTYEENLVVDKSLTIEAASSPVIDGGGTLGPGVHITAANVTFQGFIITDFTCTPDSGIGAMLVEGDGAVIDDNTIYDILPQGDPIDFPAGIGIDVHASNVEVTNNIVHDVGSIGIRVRHDWDTAPTVSNNVLLENNEVYRTANSGVLVTGYAKGVTIKTNEIYESLEPTPYNLFVHWDARDVLIENNIIRDPYNVAYGHNVVLAGCDNVTISGNTITGATSGKNIYPSEDYLPWVSSDLLSTNVNITNNDIQDGAWGIKIGYDGTGDPSQMAATTHINYNNISGNTVYGVENTIATDVDAENNWWGTVNGPDHAGNTFNVGAQGDASSDNVDYVPWLDAAYATGASFAPVTVGTGTTYHSSIQAGIDAASANDTITAAMGTFTEDLSIPEGKDNLELKPATGAAVTIKGVSQSDDSLFPYADPNINILSPGVSIHGFTIEGPDAVADKYASQMLIGASNVEIYDNNFKTHTQNSGQYSVVIQTIRKVVVEGMDISGLNIHDNTFDDIGDGTVGYDGIFINIDAGTGVVTIADNDFAGSIIRAISAERSNVVISGNDIITDLAPGLSYQGIFIGCFELTVDGDDGPVQTNVTITNNTVEGSDAAKGFVQGIRVGHSSEQIGFEDITVTNNTVRYNTDGITVKARAGADPVDVAINYNNIVSNNTNGVNNATTDAVLIDATCNWWGDVAGPTIGTNPYSGHTLGDAIFGDVTYTPWLIQSELNADWNIWSAPIAPNAASWAQMQADLVEAGVISIYYFDSATQFWGADADDAGPLDAFYIKMPDDTRIRYCISSDATFPSQKAMKVGWNLVGLAELHDMHVDEAILDAYWGTGVAGDLTGYSKVISPSLNGVYWIWQRDGGETPDMYPTRGYWVFMVNDGTLGGFTLTPIVEEEMGP